MGGALAAAAVVYGRNSDEETRNVVADSTGGRERGKSQTQTRAAFVFKACPPPPLSLWAQFSATSGRAAGARRFFSRGGSPGSSEASRSADPHEGHPSPVSSAASLSLFCLLLLRASAGRSRAAHLGRRRKRDAMWWPAAALAALVAAGGGGRGTSTPTSAPPPRPTRAASRKRCQGSTAAAAGGPPGGPGRGGGEAGGGRGPWP